MGRRDAPHAATIDHGSWAGLRTMTVLRVSDQDLPQAMTQLVGRDQELLCSIRSWPATPYTADASSFAVRPGSDTSVSARGTRIGTPRRRPYEDRAELSCTGESSSAEVVDGLFGQGFSDHFESSERGSAATGRDGHQWSSFRVLSPSST
jgi:hypothetical protein